MLKIRLITVIGFILAAIFASASAQADASADDLRRLIGQPDTAAAPALPPAAVAAGKEGAALRLTSNKNEIVRLDQDAASVIVNNPEHASVMLDSPRLLIVMPRQPGTTSFTVLNGSGEVIMQKDVIVTNVQPKYVRVRRVCATGDTSCVPAAYYYCPDGCYEVTPVSPDGAVSSIPPPAGAAATAAAATAGGMSNFAPPSPPSNSNPSVPEGETGSPSIPGEEQQEP